MWIVKNISSRSVSLVDASTGIINQLDLRPGEEITIEDLNTVLNLFSLLDPALKLIQIREDV